MSARVTFGVPVYDGEAFLPAALRSLQDQVGAEVRIVVSDNGSTDATEEICRAAAREDSRVEYHRYEQNRGGIWNYQHVMELAARPDGPGGRPRTEFFSWMAADDVKLPRFAAACLEALDAGGPEYAFACPRTQIIDSRGEVTEHLDDVAMGLDAPLPEQRIENFLRAQASHVMYGVIRQDVLARTRGITSVLGDDMVLVTELLCHGRMALAPETLFQQRRHDAQVSVNGVEATSWFAPGTRPAATFAQTRTNLGLYSGVRHTRLPLGSALRSWGAVTTRWVLPRWRAVARDVANAVGIDPRVGRQRTRQAQRAAQG